MNAAGAAAGATAGVLADEKVEACGDARTETNVAHKTRAMSTSYPVDPRCAAIGNCRSRATTSLCLHELFALCIRQTARLENGGGETTPPQ